MRILMMTSEYPPRIGGVATHVQELGRALRALGHVVLVVAPATSKGP
ncbi:MAG: Starch synthase catalytic domain, partial [Pseudomonadota bacterium]